MRIPEMPRAAAPSGVVVRVANAFDPIGSRTACAVAGCPSIRDWLTGQGVVEFAQPTICLVNGAPVLRAQWADLRIGAGDVCAFVALPHGGGGGGGKSPLRTVLQIALLVAAPALGGALGSALGLEGAAFSLFGQSISWGTVLGGAIGLAGNLLVSALLPVRAAAPSASWGGYGSTPAASPTYTLTGQGNQARLGQPIPVLYGRHLIYPDLGAPPYEEYVDNEQYLHQLHVIGQGEYEMEVVRIEDTPIASFAEVETHIVAPGEALTLVHPNVAAAPEVAGQELLGTNQLGEGEEGWIGPFVACGPDETTTRIDIDIVFGRGLYYANDGGGLDSRTVEWEVEYRGIDADGEPTGDGSWTLLAEETETASTTTAIRRTDSYEVTAGRYELRLRRTNTKDTSSRAGSEARWSALRAYLDQAVDFSGLTLLEVRMRATDNLSQRSSRLINCIVTRKLPVWSVEDGWSAPTPTRSIVWAAADVLRASYGAGLPDSRIPLAEWLALDGVLDGRADYFDGVFDTQMTVWEALTRIVGCGRAVPIQTGGRIRLFRDGPVSLPVAMFTPRNIVRGSFERTWMLPSDDTVEAVTVEYFSGETWKPAEATARARGAAYAAWLAAEELEDGPAARAAWADLAVEEGRVARVQKFGITNPAHALREADFLAHDNMFRARKLGKFSTEMDGLIPTYGDLVALSHDMVLPAVTGEVTAWSGTWDEGEEAYIDVILTLTEPPKWTDGATHWIGLRRRDGSPAGPYRCEVGSTPYRVALIDPLEMVPDVGGQRERTHFTFGPGDGWRGLVLVRGQRPRNGGRQVEIAFVLDDARVHVN